MRLTGIYGPGREWLLTQVRRGYRVAIDPPLYGNRIHADDAAGLLAFLLEQDQQGVGLDDIYIGVDDSPAPLAEVVGWLREYLGVTEWAEDASVRRAGSKRCSNARAKALGWEPKYPSYREGMRRFLRVAADFWVPACWQMRWIRQWVHWLDGRYRQQAGSCKVSRCYCFSSNHLRSPGVNWGISSSLAVLVAWKISISLPLRAKIQVLPWPFCCSHMLSLPPLIDAQSPARHRA